MKKMRLLTAGIIMTTMSIGLCGCSGVNIGPDENRYEEMSTGDQNGSYIIGAGTASIEVENLEINWVAGKINVEFAEVDEIQFSETSNKELDSDDQMRYQEKNGTLTIDFCKSNMIGIDNVPEKELTLTLPMDYQLSDTDIAVVSADVSLPEGFCTETLTVEAVSGAVISQGELVISEVKMEAVSGDVNLEIKGLEDFDMEAVSGNTTLTLPADAEFSAEIESASGDFSTDFETHKDDDVYIHGAGSTKIEMESVSGNLEIKMQQ